MKSSDFNTTCRVCGKGFASIGGLHNHLGKTELLHLEEYYQTFFPKKDLFNGKPIPFKNLNDYRTRLFVDKKSEFAYINKHGYSHGIVCKILRDQLKEILNKCPRFPSYCEWRSSKNMRFDHLHAKGNFEPFVDDAKERCKLRWRLDKPLKINKNSDAAVLVDTREQKPLFNNAQTSINVGDYTFEPSSYNGVHIDRKSKADFIQTFTTGLDRFARECDKAHALDITLVVVVEDSFSECFRFRPSLFSRQKVTGENAFNGVRQISRKYDIQFVFVEGRDKAKEYIIKILSNPELAKEYDLQYLIEEGLF